MKICKHHGKLKKSEIYILSNREKNGLLERCKKCLKNSHEKYRKNQLETDKEKFLSHKRICSFKAVNDKFSTEKLINKILNYKNKIQILTEILKNK